MDLNQKVPYLEDSRNIGIANKSLRSSLLPCGDDCFTTKQIYVEIVDFTAFVKFWTFDVKPDLSREKRLVDRITVSAGVYLDVGNTIDLIDENE